jgi:hypothetical protein
VYSQNGEIGLNGSEIEIFSINPISSSVLILTMIHHTSNEMYHGLVHAASKEIIKMIPLSYSFKYLRFTFRDVDIFCTRSKEGQLVAVSVPVVKVRVA